jgi:hypothetical protein
MGAGYMVYYGESTNAASLLSSSSIVTTPFLTTDNPGDYIIDVLGLDSDDTGLISSDSTDVYNVLSNNGSSSGMIMEMVSEGKDIENVSLIQGKAPSPFIRGSLDSSSHHAGSFSDDKDRLLRLHQHFLATEAYRNLEDSLSSVAHTSAVNSLSSVDGNDSEEGVEMADLSHHSSLPVLPSLHRRRSGSSPRSSSSNLPSVFGWESLETVKSNIQERFRYPASSFTQIWVLYCRRTQVSFDFTKFEGVAYIPFQAFLLSRRSNFYLFLQIACVGIIVAITFSYVTSSQLEAPYQVIMLLSIISLYAMILQYLLLIPEYMTERSTIMNECISRYISVFNYTMATMLTEILRAIIQVFLLLFILYTIHPLNPDSVNRNFTFICLIVGVATFQSMITLCSVITDSISVAYTIIFLILGTGTLFGGLLVRYSKIPAIFHSFYYISVTAVTQRALIANDLQCCYLTVTCNSLLKEYYWKSNDHHSAGQFAHSNSTNQVTSNFYCPPGLEFTGDGSDDGNLGRVYLLVSYLLFGFLCSLLSFSIGIGT